MLLPVAMEGHLNTGYIKSIAKFEPHLDSGMPEVIILGRSNAGKSSLINGLVGGKKIAHVSKTPGKTILLNLFKIRNKYCLVDVPGYGYAARHGDVVSGWQEMIEGYISQATRLKGAIIVVDIRRGWTDDEFDLIKYVSHYGVPIAVVFSKLDKLNRKDFIKTKDEILSEQPEFVSSFFVSNSIGTGIKEVEEFVFKNWVKNA
ncbi:MAG: ribosome biogenesis GTP-binding protein YihA/YsxC [Pseudomonadota bacterium]|nr:ribosome biogenesis GTP-binding protein YihA/YsxC [Pseudomonadota bacterium]